MPRFCAPPLACRSPYTLLDSTAMKQSMLDKLDQLANRLVELDELLMHPDATSNMDSYRKMTREHAELGPLVALYHRYQEAGNDIATAQEMLGDPDMKDFAQEEIEAGKVTMVQLERELQTMLLPKDANDERNIFLEIRAGTGGDESALFAGDLLRMYTRFAERNRWQVEMVSESPSDLGGYREVIVRLVGNGVYSKLKFESGGHRVQRVPATETQGRIHTSACTVAVMPEADEVKTSTSIPPTCASTRSEPRAPGASTSTRPTRPCA